jgi:uncharacterized protein YjiS (DUF1127 family)
MIGQLPSCKSAFPRERPKAAVDIAGLVRGPIRRLADFASAWLKRHAERRSLRSLGDHMLKDMGISRRDIEREFRDLGMHRGHVAARRLNIAWGGDGNAEH